MNSQVVNSPHLELKKSPQLAVTNKMAEAAEQMTTNYFMKGIKNEIYE